MCTLLQGGQAAQAEAGLRHTHGAAADGTDKAAAGMGAIGCRGGGTSYGSGAAAEEQVPLWLGVMYGTVSPRQL